MRFDVFLLSLIFQQLMAVVMLLKSQKITNTLIYIAEFKVCIIFNMHII